MWMHVESLLFVFLSYLMLGIFWVFDEDDFVYKNLHFALALFVFSGIALILERPWYDLTTAQYDKLSIVHCFIFAMICVFWSVIFFIRNLEIFSRYGKCGRFILGGLGAVIMALALWLAYPDFYRGGYADVDSQIIPIWLNKVGEVQSLFNRNHLKPALQLMGSAIMGMAFIGFILWKRPQENIKGWIFILVGIALFASAGMHQGRFLHYGNIISVVPLAAMLGMVLTWEDSYLTKFSKIIRICIRPFTIAAFGAGFLLIGYGCQNIVGQDPESKDQNIIPLSQMCTELNKLNINQSRHPRIVAFIDYGPEILYRTTYDVIATPYHRNAKGILDAYWIMTAGSDEKAHALIKQRGIDMVLVSNKSTEKIYYTQQHKQSTLYDRLMNGTIADWLTELTLPNPLSSTYKLYQVIR